MAPKYEVLVAISGTRNGKDWPRPGQKIDLPAAEAEDYVRAGLIRDPKAAAEEAAVARAAETATTPRRARGSARSRAQATKEAKAEPTPQAPAEPDEADAEGDEGAEDGSAEDEA